MEWGGARGGGWGVDRRTVMIDGMQTLRRNTHTQQPNTYATLIYNERLHITSTTGDVYSMLKVRQLTFLYTIILYARYEYREH